MTEWWEVGYPGGPMVPVPGFPRPLYPPTAVGYPPSEPGPDVEAYKRTVSRAGRWPWQEFDGMYSNNFAHGKPGGNVKDSGVAGVQRQAKIQDTGYVGAQTFNLFRSIIIPVGLPHAGEHAMDVTAQNLVAEAWQMFQQKPTVVTVRAAALKVAQDWIGYTEDPPESNNTMFGEWYGVNYQPWCAMFTTYCYEVGTKGGSPSFQKGSSYAYVPYIVSDARNNRNGLSTTNSPIPGDLVCYDWSRDGTYDHVGLFESGDTTTWKAVEGNTSPDDGGSQSNGGGVYRRQRSSTSAAVVFVRVEE